jgi:hypothetical protein
MMKSIKHFVGEWKKPNVIIDEVSRDFGGYSCCEIWLEADDVIIVGLCFIWNNIYRRMFEK